MSALISACKVASDQGVPLSITNAGHHAVARVLSVTQADQYLPIE